MTEALRKQHERRARNKGVTVTACQLIQELQKAPPDMPVYVARNAETNDEWYERVDRISLVPSIVLICNEDEQIVGKR